MATPAKDVIYIDVDDEITAVIEKVQDSSGKIVALVLPKRAAVFQSIVNMKLLKRTADSAKKNLVLITSESSLLPLAGATGLHVAKTLQSKPTVPSPPAAMPDTPVSVDDAEVAALSDDAPLDRSAAIGDLAGTDEDETIEVDNDSDDTTVVDTTAKAGLASKMPFNKKLKVPNFDKFRTRLFLGIAVVIALIIAWVFAVMVLPKAKITIKTDTTDIKSSIAITSSPTATETNADTKTVQGTLKEYKKTDTQKVPATGQKDMGAKASGSVTLSLSDCSKEQVTVPAGTTVSSGSFNFVTQVDVSMQSVKIGPTCRNSDFKDISTAKVKVAAQNAGDSYNLSARAYAVSGFSNVTGAGEAMSGGVSKIVKVVSQQDIDGAKQKIVDSINATANQEVTNQLKTDGYFPLTDTFTAKDPLVVASPAVDTEASEVTVNATLSYTMAGAKRDGVVQLLEADIKQNLDTSKQNILNNGLDTASIRIDQKQANGETKFELATTATAGVEQNENTIKQAVAGKKKGEVQTILQARPGVKEVKVDYSPFWVYKVPKKQSKITIVFQQQNATSSNGN